MKFKKLILYIRLFFANEKEKVYLYNKYLGIQFGENVRILHYPRFGSEPFLIKIGNNVTITRGVAFVNHDGGVALFRKEYPGLNFYGKIEIGNNVFIGINTIILPNVKIGNNVVIGAGSIVSRDVPDNVVIAGAPARIISNVDEYREKMLQKSIQIKFKNEKERKFLIEEYINKGYNV